MPVRGRKENRNKQSQAEQANQAARQPGRIDQGFNQDALVEAAEELGIDANQANQQQQARQARNERRRQQ